MNNRKIGLLSALLTASALVLSACASEPVVAPQPSSPAQTDAFIAVPQPSAAVPSQLPVEPVPAPSVSALPSSAPSLPPTAPATPSATPSTATPGSASPVPSKASSSGVRQNLLSSGAPEALSALVGRLNALSDTYSSTLEDRFEVVQDGYAKAWGPSTAAGAVITAVLDPEDIADGIRPETPQIAFLVDVVIGGQTWCLVDIHDMPDADLTAAERAKLDTNYFPYYAAYTGRCADQPYLRR